MRGDAFADEDGAQRERGDARPALFDSGHLRMLFPIVGSNDTIGVASGGETRICYDSADVAAGLADQDDEVERLLILINQGHGAGAIRVQLIGAYARTPDHGKAARHGYSINLCQIAVAVERSLGNAIDGERPTGGQNLTVNCEGVLTLDGRIGTPSAVGSCR
jgi:hypothetical protein